MILFPLFATGVIAAGVVDTGGKLPPVSLIPAANLPPVPTTLAKLVAKFAAGVADTGGNRCRNSPNGIFWGWGETDS
jgi:hypothetical protein